MKIKTDGATITPFVTREFVDEQLEWAYDHVSVDGMFGGLEEWLLALLEKAGIDVVGEPTKTGETNE